MTAQKETTLVYNYESKRYVLDGWELHCGDCFQAKTLGGQWMDVRIEMSAQCWYVVGIPSRGCSLDRLIVRRYP